MNWLRIAKSLGTVIAGKLLDADTLAREALSEVALERLRGAISTWLTEQGVEGRFAARLEEIREWKRAQRQAEESARTDEIKGGETT